METKSINLVQLLSNQLQITLRFLTAMNI
jgi:hypothetical protein